MINKTKLFYKYTDFTILQGLGATWIGQIVRYVPISPWISEFAALQISLWALGIKLPVYIVVLYIVIHTYAMMIIQWLVGKLVIKIGLYRAQNQYGAKKTHIAPFNTELIAQLEAIGEKLGVKSKFTKL